MRKIFAARLVPASRFLPSSVSRNLPSASTRRTTIRRSSWPSSANTASKCVRIFRTCWLFTNYPETHQRVDLVRERNGHGNRVGRHAIIRPLRLVMFFRRRGDGSILALRQRIIFAHEALQFREFTDYF